MAKSRALIVVEFKVSPENFIRTKVKTKVIGIDIHTARVFRHLFKKRKITKIVRIIPWNILPAKLFTTSSIKVDWSSTIIKSISGYCFFKDFSMVFASFITSTVLTSRCFIMLTATPSFLPIV